MECDAENLALADIKSDQIRVDKSEQKTRAEQTIVVKSDARYAVISDKYAAEWRWSHQS